MRHAERHGLPHRHPLCYVLLSGKCTAKNTRVVDKWTDLYSISFPVLLQAACRISYHLNHTCESDYITYLCIVVWGNKSHLSLWPIQKYVYWNFSNRSSILCAKVTPVVLGEGRFNTKTLLVYLGYASYLKYGSSCIRSSRSAVGPQSGSWQLHLFSALIH